MKGRLNIGHLCCQLFFDHHWKKNWES